MSKRKRAGQTTQAESKPGVRYWEKAEAVLTGRARWIALALVVLATVRIVSTYFVFSYTFDEPAHIAAGMQWLENGVYQYEKQHPPLTRVMAALGPKLGGAHGQGKGSIWDEGLAILGESEMDRTVALARAGILPFFWIACIAVYLTADWIAGAVCAVWAVFLLTMTPTVLAHAGLATTDMGLTAFLLLALYFGWRWAEEAGVRPAIGFGAFTGLAVLAKFSTMAFLPSVVAVGLVYWWGLERASWAGVIGLMKPRIGQFLIAVCVAAVVIWGGYRFSFGPSILTGFAVPAHELFDGVAEVQKHDRTGHLTYLMGKVNTVGWPYFYVVALGVKTPLPVLGLALAGVGLLVWDSGRRKRAGLVVSTIAGVLLFSSFLTQIKIGTRHVLPVYAAFAVAGGYAAVWLLRKTDGRLPAQIAVCLVLLWVPATSLAAHPDYIGYFNALAGDAPQDFLVDSDLDWGQDNKRLARRLKELQAGEVYYNKFVPGDLTKLLGFPPVRPLDADKPGPGWNAVSLTPLKLGLFGDTRYDYPPDFRFWPELRTPNERVGTGILLFYVPPESR
jgi:hypothetical protein